MNEANQPAAPAAKAAETQADAPAAPVRHTTAVHQTLVVTAAAETPVNASPGAKNDAGEPAALTPAELQAAERQSRKDQALLTGQAALALLDRYQHELLQLYPELQGRIYGEDALPEGSSPELLTVYEDLEAIRYGIGAIEEIGIWLHPSP